MRTDMAIDKLCAIAPTIADISDKISSDVELRSKLVEFAQKECQSKSDFIRFLPLLMKKCENEVYFILAILTEKSIEEIKSQNAMVTFNEVKSLVTDKDFRDFFSQSVLNKDSTEAQER